MVTSWCFFLGDFDGKHQTTVENHHVSWENDGNTMENDGTVDGRNGIILILCGILE